MDYNSAGVAEAFQAIATASGATTNITFYLDSNSSAPQVVVGLYADAAGHPGTLLAEASTSQPIAGTWNTLHLPGAAITQGSTYWIAILGTSGTVRFRDRSHGCSSETSSSLNLSNLPSTWITGKVYTDCPLSSYITQ